MLDEEGLEEFLFSRYTRSGDRLFRMERLPHYDVPSQNADRESWKAGRFDASALEQWAEVLADDRRRGLISRRVRVLSATLTDDEAMSCHVALPIIGRDQEVRILHRGEHPVPTVLDHDYWVVEPTDGPVEVVRMVYSETGSFLGADVIPTAQHGLYLAERDLAWSLGEPFVVWWDRHYELRRPLAA